MHSFQVWFFLNGAGQLNERSRHTRTHTQEFLAIAMNSTAAAPSPAAGAQKLSSEQKSETPISNPNPNPNPTPAPTTRASRWSDAPPSNDANSASEPPQKKVKNDVSSLSSAGEGVAGHGAGVNEGPPGLAYAQTASAATVTSYGTSEQGGTAYGGLQQTTSYQSYGSQYQAPPPIHGSFAPGSAKGTGALFYKTKLCTKFKIGACTFNERCHFAHGVEDLRKPPPLWETMTGGMGSGSNPAGASTGSFMVQPRPKTRPCRYFAEGNCPYNERCNFLHGNEEPQRMQGVGGSYAATGMQVPVVTAAQPQGYSGVSAYPNGGNVPTSMQYPNMNAGFTAPTPYANPSMVPSSLPTPYAAQPNYPSAGAVAPNIPPYGSMPVTTNAINSYPSSQDGTNGASANYNSWNGGPGVATNSTPGYTQTNQQMANQGYQTASWMHNYAAGGYPKAENEIANPQYPQEQAQHNQVTSSTPYAQGVSQNPQQGGTTMHADGNHFQNVYNAASYPNQQADYTARYNMAEAWGGQTQ